MRLSVIVSTYEQPEWLGKVLWGYAHQSFRDFELVVADDGSGPGTRRVVEALRSSVGAPLHHIWHEDRGFRKCEILNKAVLATSGEYLVFTDGDCIPRLDFLTMHDALAEPGRFLSGGALRIPGDIGERLTREDIRYGRFSDFRWLRASGAPFTRRLLRYAIGPRTARVLDRLTPTAPTWNGGNSSAWRTDVLAANGFDERLGYGGEDREFGERLERAGIRGKQVRHRALVVHMEHERGYDRPEVIRANDAIRREAARRGLTRTEFGLDRHVAER